MERKFGKYTLVERLGGGGMAEVYRARFHGPQGFEKDVAVKLILPQFSDDPEFVKMFVHEATVAARLDHASIVRIHEFDVVDGTYYIAMELVEGKDLRALLARAQQMNRKLTVPQALMIALEVARGLAFAHGDLVGNREPIIHRDISPHNIIISRAGEVKITDFGIAKAASAASLTRTGVVKGKAAYMSPEQARGEPVDTRSDIFSLGCVLWEMLTGQRLFTGENDFAILEKLQKSPIPPPSQYEPAVPPELDRLVLKCLERDPGKRVQSAAELVRELDKLLVATGVERTTLLADLYHSLFAEGQRHTRVLPSSPAWPAPARSHSEEKIAQAEAQSDEKGKDALAQNEGKTTNEPTTFGGPTIPDMHPPADTAALYTESKTELMAAEGQTDRPRLKVSKLALATTGTLLVLAFVWWLIFWEKSLPENRTEQILPASIEATAGEKSGEAADQASPSAAEPTSAIATVEPSVQQPSVEEKKTPPKEDKRFETTNNRSGDTSINLSRKNVRSVEYGTLELNAIPWAKVYRKGRLVGITPLRMQLPVGEHTLVLENEELKVRTKEKISIQAKQVTRKVLDLRPQNP